jgi:hypothetical protein
MHVVWKRQNSEDGRLFLLAVFLVTGSGRTASPGLESATLLSTVEERFITAKIKGMREFYRGLFWTGIDNNLDRLALEPLERAMVEAEIMKKVSRPRKQWALWGVTCNSRFD